MPLTPLFFRLNAVNAAIFFQLNAIKAAISPVNKGFCG